MGQARTHFKRLLVCIASYGTRNDKYLSRLISEYRSMPYDTHIVVFSNVTKDLGPDVEVIVGLPTRDPRSLPFAPQPVLVNRANDYDVFIYSEDDTLITECNIEAFLRVSEELPEDEVPGFLRFEKDEFDCVSYPDVHGGYHWDTGSVRSRGYYTFAFFTNEHSACYALTRAQLARVIDAGGFLAGPRRGRYDVLETAATDPYTTGRVTKLLCISHLEDFLIHHLPNKYVNKLGLNARQFEYQIRQLLDRSGRTAPPLLREHSEFRALRFGKNYYEPVRTDLTDLIPADARSVLSVGCGWGATEEWLARTGKRVVCVPLDSAISACAAARGLEMAPPDFGTGDTGYLGDRFECLVISNTLHLAEDPSKMLDRFVSLLKDRAVIIASVPNLRRVPVVWRRLRGKEPYKFLGNYARSGVHFSSPKTMSHWLSKCGLRTERVLHILPDRVKAAYGGAFAFVAPLVSSEVVVVASKA